MPFIHAIKKGDVLLTSAKDDGVTWWSVLIWFWTLCRISHALLYIGNGRVIEAIAGIGVREAPLPAKFTILTMDLTDAQRNELCAWAKAQVGKKYSWSQFLCAAFPRNNTLRRLAEKDEGFICTALDAAGYRHIGRPFTDEVAPTPRRVRESQHLRLS